MESMSVFSKIISYVKTTKDPIKAARDMGVKVGNNTRFISMPNFSSEPYLVSIGDHVTIASQVSFLPHDGGTWCFRNEEGYENVLSFAPIKIGNNCFVGYRSTILKGVTIGNNVVVGACSLVTKNIPDNQVWGGTRSFYMHI